MKRSFVKFTSRKFMSVVLIAAAAVVITPLAKANDNKKAAIEIVSSDNKTSVQFSGSTAGAFMFDVKISNPTADKFTLIIQAADGEVLYSKDYSDVDFTKKVKLLKSDENSSYKFTIKSANKALENSFVVNTSSKIVDDVVVTKL
ncbi:hypothetical protein BH11BAC6_BH11BAC6_09680 [soil metagenome]